ncbi:hypothetical protein Z945_1226 [Sulfitobacter noctilucae]|nr:hypothetical protein Z945_1226 [Sulfitobacter noctilucae]
MYVDHGGGVEKGGKVMGKLRFDMFLGPRISWCYTASTVS